MQPRCGFTVQLRERGRAPAGRCPCLRCYWPRCQGRTLLPSEPQSYILRYGTQENLSPLPFDLKKRSISPLLVTDGAGEGLASMNQSIIEERMAAIQEWNGTRHFLRLSLLVLFSDPSIRNLLALRGPCVLSLERTSKR